MKILVIQGPNLNMLGHRDPRLYGPVTLDQIHENLENFAKQNEQSDLELEFFQTNFEGEIIDRIQECVGSEVEGIIINPGAFSHTSVAIADAIMLADMPVIEVHLSNIFAREDFRKTSYTGAASMGVVTGLGHYGYHVALIAMMQVLAEIKAIKENQVQNNSTPGGSA
ncbi:MULTISPECIES: type II 3-dehydroquinate dehydratase [Helicobacter]|uniref:type II 3-dehydroquinate dehydratase n=1 Tax=Helicobacter TaxID=209 RepID=UPI000EB09A19|nr:MULTISPECIES: type II 3-dehydroquinate dehydratase [Helicobacter]